MLGVLYTLLAAATFGLNNAQVRRGVITGTVTQAVVISMPIGLAMFALVAAAAGQLGAVASFTPGALAALVSAGIVHFVLGRYCNYRSIQAMGANLSAPIQQWSLLVSLSLALVFLGESLDLMKLAGIGLLVLGPAMAARTRNAPPASGEKRGFQPKLAEGYLFALLSCLAYGTSPILVRAGLEGTGLALAGGVVSYAAATVAVVLILTIPAPRRDAAAVSRGNLLWFFWTGVTVCISQIFLYMAMAIAPVVVVQPLMRLATIFRTLFSWLLNREHEVFNRGVLVAIGLSLVGALALTIDGEAAVRWLGAPAWLVEPFAWRWPAR